MRVLAVTNMFPTPETPTSGTFVEQQVAGLRRAGVEVEVMLVRRAQDGMRTYLGVPRELRRHIARFRPDLIHAMYGGVLAARVTGAAVQYPTVVTFHGSDLLGEHLAGRYRQVLARCGVWASWKAARRASRIVVVSRNLQAALPRDLAKAKIAVIPCGIDLDRFKPLDKDRCRTELGWKSGTFHVLFPASGGNAIKRFALAKAAVDVLTARFNVRVELHSLQGVPYDRVPAWMNASDVILMTSLHEGSPTVIKEALACDVAVVSVDVGDIRERIDGIDGCYLASADANALAAKLLLVRSNNRTITGRIRMAEFALERIAHRVIAVYRDALFPPTRAIESSLGACSG